VISIQTGTDLTFSDLLDIMGLRSGLQEECFQMEVKLDYFLQYDEEFICEATFYEELSALGRTTEKTVDEALSESGEFLRCLMDVDGIFQGSRTECSQLASDIMIYVDRGMDVDPLEAGDIVELRKTLGRKFARMKGSWENLLQSAMDHDESPVFCEISELVEITESIANEALFGSEDLLQSLRDRDWSDWSWDVDKDSAPNAEGSSVTEDEEADGVPEPGSVTSTNAATGEVASGTPGSKGAVGAPGAGYGKGQVALVSESVF
jgi:hypothetical protein